MAVVYLGLGTNIGDRLDNLRRAVSGLGEIADIQALSRVYETAPLYVTDQPSFLNMAARIDTGLDPVALLRRLKAMEAELGRTPSVRYGPRLIDLDILVYGEMVLDTPDLTLPHPRLAERRFALAPLTDVAVGTVRAVAAAQLSRLPDDDGMRVMAEAISLSAGVPEPSMARP